MVTRELGAHLLNFLHPPVRIAFVGHRPNRLPAEALSRVRASIEAALGLLEEAGMEAAHRRARFEMVTALAEGADRIAAEAALARGWGLEAPLPFSVERYEKDFADAESVAAFKALLNEADKVRPAPKFDDKPDEAYRELGARLIKNADALLTVWNGAPGSGPGGTADVAARALDSGAPVIWIGFGEREKPKLISPTMEDERKGPRALYMRGALSARFERIARPAELQAQNG